jgi:UDP:flavonoid glycosyltransferase YjiC (YdhE family)
MKVLVVSTPGLGHLNPLVPLVRAFLAGGDQVVVASGVDLKPRVEAVGAEFFAVGHGEDAWMDQLRQRTRGTPGDGIAPDRILHYFVPRVFAEIAAADMIDGVLDCGRRLAPDLVLFENLALAGPLAADVLGVRSANHLLGPLTDHEVFELANDAVSPMWRSFGRDVPGYAGVYRDLTIEICPPSLERLKVPSGEVLSLRPAPLPEAPATRSSRPLVYVTFGTFFSHNIEIFRPVLEGLAEEPIDIVVTVGSDGDPAALAPFPANTRVERFIPQAELLPRCDAVVHHGGAGTTFGALAHGLPQLVIPQGADNFTHAAMVDQAGDGLVLLPGEATPSAVRDAVRRIVAEPTYAAAARRTADEIAVMAGPAEVAEALRSYARR